MFLHDPSSKILVGSVATVVLALRVQICAKRPAGRPEHIGPVRLEENVLLLNTVPGERRFRRIEDLAGIMSEISEGRLLFSECVVLPLESLAHHQNIRLSAEWIGVDFPGDQENFRV